MCDELKRFDLKRCLGDAYSAEFATSTFRANGIMYTKSKKNKAELFLELLPRICSHEIELLDNETLINQLASLERRCKSGGKDSIDHPKGGHDDLANVVAGASFATSKPVKVITAGFRGLGMTA